MSLHQLLDQLAAFTPTTLPVLGLYLNAQADQHGRDSSPLSSGKSCLLAPKPIRYARPLATA